ncbi:hypothetical protein L9F63_009013, partial [Diploptera punctata]
RSQVHICRLSVTSFTINHKQRTCTEDRKWQHSKGEKEKDSIRRNLQVLSAT